METFLEFLIEVLKGVVREVSAHFVLRSLLDNKKTTSSRSKQKGGSPKEYVLTTTTLTVEAGTKRSHT
ncbi:hypothetical protein [Neobacillus niacini]|uniref:hypothetical protein n=1 Tax=Neobacillus niacini TaxID=86668 RepID=UPI001C8DD821|nr:hypothetical protein [Neobacillus niacini]MBY0145077.1 hypothetical protein [Neobacillus niacini]